MATPIIQQYKDIKSKYENYILFFRLGDFYEMFYDDAVLASSRLDLVLTGKDCGEEQRAPMCGIPFHSADNYIIRLISQGFKVAICEQTETAEEARGGLIKRDVVRLITPGTITGNGYLDESRNNYLCSVYIPENFALEDAGICIADVSTGDINACNIGGVNVYQRILNELSTYNPREIILNKYSASINQLLDFIKNKLGSIINATEEDNERFDTVFSRNLVVNTFDKITDEKISANKSAVLAAGALLSYIEQTQKSDVVCVKNLNFYNENQYLELDYNTRRNLELCTQMRTGEKRGSLLWVIDNTKTSIGARMLRKWLERPLVNIKAIERRLGAVEELFSNFLLREDLCELLKSVLDIERIMARIVYGNANSRDLVAMANTFAVIPKIKLLLSDSYSDELKNIYENLDELSDIYDLISSAIIEEPPFSIREGGFIKKGYNSEIDELLNIINNSKDYIDKIEQREREETGIKGLKIGYNRVFGYYIDITKSNLSDIPQRYIRKQTLSNSERFITEELKNLEGTILGASDKETALEYDLFCEIRKKISSETARIQITSEMIAALDSYLSLALTAFKNNYTYPNIEYGTEINIKEGRHPIVEQFVSDGNFIPNDTLLDTKNNRMVLITGPNMAGKSTYMRQIAAIVILAQIGSYVPAREASVGVIDKLFTRIGASDDLSSGQSTFMLEMTEVAYILKNATERSLIIYDEIGRGTSTFDGMSIARAIIEYTQSKKIGAKTLFATHYHELTVMENEFDGVVNYNIAAKKKGDDLVFLRKIIKGAADDSYGIEVAKLAGVPIEIIKRAKEVLKTLEEKSKLLTHNDIEIEKDKKENNNITFDDIRTDEIIEKLKKLDCEMLTPIEALNFLYDLKKMLK